MSMNAYQLARTDQQDTAYKYLAAFGLCTSDGGFPSGDAMIQAFVNWAQQHPERWSAPAYSGITMAYQGTWFCPKPK
jgi:hypothetical protein